MKKISVYNDVRIYLEGFGFIKIEEDGGRWRMDIINDEQELENLLISRPIKGGGTYYDSAKSLLKTYDADA